MIYLEILFCPINMHLLYIFHIAMWVVYKWFLDWLNPLSEWTPQGWKPTKYKLSGQILHIRFPTLGRRKSLRSSPILPCWILTLSHITCRSKSKKGVERQWGDQEKRMWVSNFRLFFSCLEGGGWNWSWREMNWITDSNFLLCTYPSVLFPCTSSVVTSNFKHAHHMHTELL